MSFKETSSMKSKYVRGVKRNQIIQRWLQGIEDPLYEVFPTKKEGKYIVKPREVPIKSDMNEQSVDDTQNELSYENTNETSDHMTETNDYDDDSTFPKGNLQSKKQETTPLPRIQRSVKQLPKRSPMTRVSPNMSDSTINLEILEQLRSLGEEIRNDRFKKEQKNFIKQVVNKELNKSRIRSKYVPDIFPDTPFGANATLNDLPEDKSVKQSIKDSTEPTPTTEAVNETPLPDSCEPERPIFRSRIRR